MALSRPPLDPARYATFLSDRAVEIVVRPDGEMTEQERAEYAERRAAIDYGERLDYQFASEREWRVLARIEGRLASHVGVGRRRVAVGGQEQEVGAVGGVWTAPELRGRGLARLAMAAATALLGDLGVAAGLLLCREQVAPFYERLGWQRVPGPALFDQAAGRVVWDRPILVWLCDLPAWPDGVIDLRGPPW